MVYKFVIILAFAAFAYGFPAEYDGHKGLHSGAYSENEEYHNVPADYNFQYTVHDEHTGDIKSQQEVRKGTAVQGRYELIDSDGHRRIVEYTADEHNGFNAVVHREPTDIKIPHYVAPKAYKADQFAGENYKH